MKPLVIGTRESKLALWQTRYVIAELKELFHDLECRIETFKTIGDDIVDRPLPELGGKGIFTTRLESALLQGDIDLAIHSFKDLPIEMPAGLTIGAVTCRADPRDVLLTRDGVNLDDLPAGAVIGTSSLRRQAQMLARRPDLTIRPIRGNVETRQRKVMKGDYHATVLAAAGIDRLKLDVATAERLPLEAMLPAPGQGAIAVQCRENDTGVLQLLAQINHDETRRVTRAERTFLAGLGGGCAAPVAAFAYVENNTIYMTGLVTQPDGKRQIRVEGSDTDSEALGRQLAEQAIGRGAGSILAASRTELEKRLPLHGKRIAVTRAADQADELCAALTGMGATLIRVPMIRIVPIADHILTKHLIENASPADWVVFMSANAVKVLWDSAQEHEKVGVFRKLRVAAVGIETANALKSRSIVPDFVPTEFTGERIGCELPEVEGRNIWLPRAKSNGQAVVDELRKRGARVHDLAVYRTESVDFDSIAVQNLEQGVDAILFTSGSTAQNFVSACANQGWDVAKFKGSVIACIGSSTERTAKKLGFENTITPNQFTSSALADAVADYFCEIRISSIRSVIENTAITKS